MTVELTVRERTAEAAEGAFFICGNAGDTVQFDSDAEWDAYAAKTARFRYTRNGSEQYQDVLFEGAACPVPVLNDITEVAVGVYAGDIRTTTPAYIPCLSCITDGAPQHAAPLPDVYDQLLEYLAGLQNGAATGDAYTVLSGGIAETITGIAETEEEA